MKIRNKNKFLKENMDSGLSKLFDPKYVGPGVWYNYHTQAYNAKTPEQITTFIADFKRMIDEFKCEVCRGHAQEYLKTNPIERYRNEVDKNGQPIGMFKYVWEFHNAVNARLGKKIVPFDVALNFYANKDNVCTKTCGADHDTPIPAMPLATTGSDHLSVKLPFIPVAAVNALYPPATSNVFAVIRSAANVTHKYRQ